MTNQYPSIPNFGMLGCRNTVCFVEYMKYFIRLLLIVFVFLLCSGCVKDDVSHNQAADPNLDLPAIQDTVYSEQKPDLDTAPIESEPASQEESSVPLQTEELATDPVSGEWDEEDPEVEENHVETIGEGQGVGGV